MKATGKLAKTDRIDAQILARFAGAVAPKPSVIPGEGFKRSTSLHVPSSGRTTAFIARLPYKAPARLRALLPDIIDELTARTRGERVLSVELHVVRDTARVEQREDSKIRP